MEPLYRDLQTGGGEDTVHTGEALNQAAKRAALVVSTAYLQPCERRGTTWPSSVRRQVGI